MSSGVRWKNGWLEEMFISDTGVILDRMPQEQFLRMVREHGADRIVFGTDSPWADQKKFVEILKEMPLEEEERNQIFAGTAVKLLGL